jgi:hypothetical protein
MIRQVPRIVDVAAVSKARAALAEAVRRWPRLTEPAQRTRLATYLQPREGSMVPRGAKTSLIVLGILLCGSRRAGGAPATQAEVEKAMNNADRLLQSERAIHSRRKGDDAPEGQGAYRTSAERQNFIDLGQGSWWCATALKKGKAISWCGWGPRSVAEWTAKEWRSDGVPGDVTGLKIVGTKRIYYIETFNPEGREPNVSRGQWALKLTEARKAAKEAEEDGYRVKWHLFTRAEYFDACFDFPACL